MSHAAALTRPSESGDVAAADRASVSGLLLMAVWFALLTGLIEGVGLLVFQRINWARWGAMLHVSGPIIWIAAVVDVALFGLIAMVLAGIARGIRRFSAIRVLAFVLSTFMVYDWLTVTARLYRLSCLLLALGVATAFTRWMSQREVRALRFWRRTVPGLAGIVILGAVGIEGGAWWSEQRALAELPAAQPGTPNVLVIVVDTLRADHLSAYGYSRQTSPNLDRLARQGVLFENAFSTTSWSYPSHVSLVTGSYQFEHRMAVARPVPWFSHPRESLSGLPTLGESLERRGYRTAAFSANRAFFSRNLGFGRGFIHFEDYLHSPSDMFVRTLFGREFSRMVLVRSERSKYRRALRWLGFDSLLDRDDEGLAQSGGSPGVRKRAMEVNRELLGWIDRSAPQRPFFAFMNYFDVHEPYGGPFSYTAGWPKDGVGNLYDNGVKYVDDAIGQLISELERRGLTHNTLLVITSDHGEELGEHGLATHGEALYRAEIQVPLIFWYPGQVPGGVRMKQAVTNAALPATVMDVLGDRSAAGRFSIASLTPHWTETPAGGAESVLSELAENVNLKASAKSVPTAVRGAMKSLVSGSWHLVVHKTLGGQLYDWSRDPGESVNLIGRPEASAVVGDLMTRMQGALGHTPERRSMQAGVLHNGVLKRASSGAAPSISEYYRLESAAGSTVMVEVRGAKFSSQFDPAVAITDDTGQLLHSCRNPGDDRLQPPGASDRTPGDFDDLCFNDDAAPGENRDSRLEVMVSGAPGSSVQLYLRVSDWDGRFVTDMQHEIEVSGLR